MFADSLAGTAFAHDEDAIACLIRRLLSDWVCKYAGTCSSNEKYEVYNKHNLPSVSLQDTCYNQFPNMTECGPSALVNMENVSGIIVL